MFRFNTSLLIALAAPLVCATSAAAPQQDTSIAVPQSLDDYHFINAVAIDDPDDPLHGFHHFYVNDAGVQAFREGGPYPAGTQFVGLIYQITRDGAIRNEGDGKAVALMEKVEGAEETGGWHFALLAPDGSSQEIDPVKDCFECHTQVRDRDFVFSQPLHVGELGWMAAEGQ